VKAGIQKNGTAEDLPRFIEKILKRGIENNERGLETESAPGPAL